jgi:hypothetical protein
MVNFNQISSPSTVPIALPLQVSVEFAAPLAVVQCITRKQPQALMCGTDVGWLLLHAAAKCASLEVVQCQVHTGNIATLRPLETASFSNFAASVPSLARIKPFSRILLC